MFRGKNTRGAPAPLNGGFFEGDTRSSAFDEPRDGIGLSNIYGDRVMTSDITSTYAVRGYDYNDYQLSQPYLAVESNSPSTAQNIVRNYFLPEFDCLYIAENPPRGGSSYYTDNASALVLANLGLYPLQSPGASWVINSPAVTTARDPRRDQADHSDAQQFGPRPVCVLASAQRLRIPESLHLGRDPGEAWQHTRLRDGEPPRAHRSDVRHRSRWRSIVG
jgi:hypothetical protein